MSGLLWQIEQGEDSLTCPYGQCNLRSHQLPRFYSRSTSSSPLYGTIMRIFFDSGSGTSMTSCLLGLSNQRPTSELLLKRFCNLGDKVMPETLFCSERADVRDHNRATETTATQIRKSRAIPFGQFCAPMIIVKDGRR